MRPLTKLTNRFTETSIDDEIVIMRLDNGEFFALSETAAAAWQLIDGCRDRQAMLRALACQYDVDEEAIAEDIDELLTKLRQMGIIERG